MTTFLKTGDGALFHDNSTFYIMQIQENMFTARIGGGEGAGG